MAPLEALEALEVLPAASVAVAVIAWEPVDREEPGVKDQSPLPSAVVVPMEEPSEKSSTVLLASAVPVKVGVVSSVILSVEELPESEAEERSGVDGADGAAGAAA